MQIPPFVQDLETLGNFNAAQDGWLGELLQTSHLFIFRVDRLDNVDTYSLALGYFEGSACRCWPGSIVKCAGAGAHAFFQPDLTIEEPTFRAVVDVDSVAACSLVWRGPLWQRVMSRR